MYKVLVDTHTHTVASGHAFGTVQQNARQAAAIGLEAIAITDHFGPLFTPVEQVKAAQHIPPPKTAHGIRILSGVEIDIVDLQGRLFTHNWRPDSDGAPALQHFLQSCDLVIASVHPYERWQSGSVAEHTAMYINAIQTPGVHILGHIGRSGLAFEIDEVLTAARDTGKMIEINSQSLAYSARIRKVCRKITERCAALGVYITVGSDAHSPKDIGDFANAIAMLQSIHFPEALIANASLSKLMKIITQADRML